jgi:glycerol uptake facilitator-like aquaporin
VIYNDGGSLDGITELTWDNSGGSQQLDLDAGAGSDIALFTISNAGSGSAAEFTGEFKATAGLVQTITAATDTLNSTTDAGEVIICNRATAQTITLPEATLIGQTYLIVQRGAGAVTIQKLGSHSINGAASVTIQNQWGAATLILVASTVWIAIGDL